MQLYRCYFYLKKKGLTSWWHHMCFFTLGTYDRKIGEISEEKCTFLAWKFINEFSSDFSDSQKNVSNFFFLKLVWNKFFIFGGAYNRTHFCTALMIRMPTFCAIFIMFRDILALPFGWPKNSGKKSFASHAICVLLSQGQKKMAENHPSSSSVFCRLQKMMMIKGLSSALLIVY